MDQGLVALLKNKSPEELRAFSKLAERIAGSRERLDSVFYKKLEEVVATGDTGSLDDFTSYISAYRVPETAPQNTSDIKALRNSRDSVRIKIEEAIYNFYDKNTSKPRTKIRILDFLSNIPEVKKLVGDNPLSLARYLTTIRKNPKSRIRYDIPTRTYTISAPLNYETVAHAADEIYKKQGVVTKVDIDNFGISGSGKSIGNYLHIWARSRHMKSEGVSMGRHHSHVAYFRGKRPPVSPLERVKAFISGKKKVRHEDIKEATGLRDKSIETLMGTSYLGFPSRETPHGRIYIKD